MTDIQTAATRPNVRKVRHYKQRFDPNARMIWRKPVLWDGVLTKPGDLVPQALQDNRIKLARFWRSGYVEILRYAEPEMARVNGSSVRATGGKGDADAASDISGDAAAIAEISSNATAIAEISEEFGELPNGTTLQHLKGSWYIATVDGVEHKLNGKRAVREFLDKARNMKEAKAEGTQNAEDWLS